ncbi:hypothetical protein [Halogranum rubrum]|uniref:hypothetical protein n=1 Tax=Halogranum rubrum TaxID=553466 RepID=UPI0012F722DC|nr:hypothetical protein [Halogranum salarium]
MAVADKAAQAIDQLTEYMELLRDDDAFVASGLSGVTIRGGVFVEPFVPDISSSDGIQIFSYGNDLRPPI